MDATIVKLSPSTSQVRVVSFEEAFGEHSELRGRGRARRQKRRQTRKMTRLQNKQERKRLKQSIKNEAQESRQTRRDTSKSRRVARKAMGEEEESAEEMAPETAQPTSEGYSEDQNYDAPEEEAEQSESEEETAPEEYDFENGSNFEGEYSEARGRGARRSGGHGKSRGLHRGPGKLVKRIAEKHAEKRAAKAADLEPAEDQVEAGEEMESLDGEYMSSATGQPVNSIHPPIKDLTKRIVWNKAAMKRHSDKKARLHSTYSDLARSNRTGMDLSSHRKAIELHTIEIQRHEARIEALENALKKFGNHPHIPHGYKLAQIQLQKQLEGKNSAEDKSRIRETIVQKDLNPTFSKERIEVPAQPAMRIVELSSNADGSKNDASIHSTGMSKGTKIVLGLAALGVAAYFAKKHKLI